MAPLPLESHNLGIMLNMQGISLSFPEQLKLRFFVCFYFGFSVCCLLHSEVVKGNILRRVLVL